jgi:hypothetical protein
VIPTSEPSGSPETATEQPGRVVPQLSVESAQESRESSEMHMPEVSGAVHYPTTSRGPQSAPGGGGYSVDREPEERRKETHLQRDGGDAANEGREEDRRGQQAPPGLDTAGEPDEATSSRQEPFPHGEERPQDGLERTWWRRIFRGPHEEDTERRWWEFWR